MFHRAANYDTGNDSIVRVSANDVRKRMAMFYQEGGADWGTIIDLPPGTYIPRLRRLRQPDLAVAPVDEPVPEKEAKTELLHVVAETPETAASEPVFHAVSQTVSQPRFKGQPLLLRAILRWAPLACEPLSGWLCLACGPAPRRSRM